MPLGYLCLVLHAHLPYVRHPEYDDFLEERGKEADTVWPGRRDRPRSDERQAAGESASRRGSLDRHRTQFGDWVSSALD